MTVDLICKECSTPYKVKPYRAKKSKYCSKQCAGAVAARERLNVGPKKHLIGNKFRVGKPPANAFKKGLVGEKNPAWKEGIHRICEHCDRSFKQKPWLAKQNGLAKFCSRACFESSGIFVAEKSPCYVGGITTYRGKGWLEIRSRVVSEQNGCCGHCGKHVGKSLPVHHIIPYREFSSAKEANQRDNLIGLCQSCHMKAERSA